jgi:glycosidase
LWLTPIFTSPSYHGYDTTDYYTINPDFGTEDDLRELVREAHKRNIRILLDYVVAHSSNQHPFFKDAFGNLNSKYAGWYRWTNAEHTQYESFFGIAELPTLNHDNPDTQKYLIDIAKYWMNTGIDGYRADYVLNVPHAFWKKLRAEVKAVNPDFVLLAEAWTNGLGIKPYYDNEFDAAFDFPLYGDIEGSNDKIGDSVLAGIAAPQLIDGTLATAQRLYPPNAQRVTFINNHDTNRAASEAMTDPARAKLGAILLLTLPGTAMIYYGEEIGMAGVKADAPDYDKTRREPMDWYTSETGAGMTSWFKPVYRNNKPSDGISIEEQQGKPESLLEYYRALTALRNANASLRTGLFEPVDVQGEKVYAYLRQDDKTSFLIVFNFANSNQSLRIDLGASSLPDGRYLVIDMLSRKELTFTSFVLTLDATAKTGYVVRFNRF